MDKILVVGASGTVGTELTKLLKAKGQTVVRATSQAKLAADQVHLDLAKGEGIAQAFEGVDRAFLLSPPGYTNQDQLLEPVIKEAKKRNLKKVVLMTAMGANANEAAPMRKAELHLERSGVPYNIIRPNWFMQNFNTFWIQGILSQGKIFLPVGKAKGSFIDARDIAAVASELLLTRAHDNRDFDLTGAEALDHDQVASILSKATGKSIAFQDISPEAMLSGLLEAKLPREYAEFLIMILGFFKQGYSERTTDAVRVITGHDPIRFEKYASDYKGAWTA